MSQKSRGGGTGPCPLRGLGGRDVCRLPPSQAPLFLPLPVGDFSKIRKSAVFDQLWNFVGGKPPVRSRVPWNHLWGQRSPNPGNFEIHNRTGRLKVIGVTTPTSAIWTQFSKNCRGGTPAPGAKIFAAFCRGRLALQNALERSALGPRVCPRRAPKVGQKR
jgi:hypothetical protein